MAKTVNRSSMLLASAVAGIMSVAAIGAPAQAEAAQDVRCYGVNKCKGAGACGGKGHSCAGKNSCKGQGYLKLEKQTCLKIDGGRLTPKADKS